MRSTARVDPVKLAAMFRSQDGPVMRHVGIVATSVQGEAKRRVGYNAEKPPGEQGGAHLRDTIVKRFVQEGTRPVWRVGSEHPIAALHHDGTRPHEIVPRRARLLRWAKAGVVYFATRVQHPGTRPNPYLEDAGRALGLKVRRKL